jgi:hypothetical protein
MEAMARAASQPGGHGGRGHGGQAGDQRASPPAGRPRYKPENETDERKDHRSILFLRRYYGHYKKVNVFRGREKWLKGQKS